MDRLRRIAGMGKAKEAAAGVQKDKDESVVFFRELYKREKERDVNLLEPMYSVEFDAIQGGGHVCKVPSVKRDFLIPVDEKHDYDWLKSTPATPLFPSLEMEASASHQTAFQKEPPTIPPRRQVKPSSTPRVAAGPVARKLPPAARPAPPTANKSSSPAAVSKEKKTQRHAEGIINNRSSHTKAAMNAQQKKAAVPALGNSGRGAATKKHSERCYASRTGAVKGAAAAQEDSLGKAPRNNLSIASGPMFRRHGFPPSSAEKASPAVKKEKEYGNPRRRHSCSPAVKEQQVESRQTALLPPSKGRSLLGATKGTRTTYHGKKEQRPELGTQANK